MKVLIVSAIWPPDVGGPASHGPELGAFLTARGHDVRAVTTRAGNAEPMDPGFPMRSVSRGGARARRIPAAAIGVARAIDDADVVYSTGMYVRSAASARLRRRPLVMKLVADPAYERARSLGLFDGTLEEFQTFRGGTRVRALKHLRQTTVGRATRLFTPSHYLAEVVRSWGLPADRVGVIPNPAPPAPNGVGRDELRRRLGMSGPTYVFAGRLVPQKNVPLVVDALRSVPDATLVLVGDGESEHDVRVSIERGGVEARVRLTGMLPRAEGMQWVRAADAAVLPSDWENFPHAAVEALAVGTPVIATAVGGVPEIVTPGVNGLLVERGDSDGLARAMARVADEPGLRDQLARGAVESADRFTVERAFGAIERELELAAD